MEARLSRIHVIITFRNMRFDYDAMARSGNANYDLISVHWNHLFHHASDCYGRSLHGGFNGPCVALFPGAVHSPRFDDLHDREWNEIHLRGWGGPAGFRAVPDRGDRSQNPSQSRTLPWRSLYGRHIRRRGRLDCGRAGNPDESARDAAALGQAA